MKRFFLILSILGHSLFSQTSSTYSINGVFLLNQAQYYDASGTTLITHNSVAAYFSQTAVANIQPNMYSSAGNVSFNNNALSYNSNINVYSLDNVQSISTQQWDVSGNSSIPAMSFMYNGVIPSFSIPSTMLKDTLDKSDTLFVTINGIEDADSIFVYLSDSDQQTSQHFVAFHAPNYTDKYYLPPAVFQTLSDGSRGVIKVEAINNSYQTTSGETFLFTNIYSFVKTNITIIN